jgi:uncharacterized protein YndB with AHSA1/START domain
VSSPRLELTAPRDEPVLVFRRAFAAPAALVFQAWTEPEHLRHWRAPHGFELVTCEVDLRVGGGYRFVHRAPDGSRHAFRGQYRRIERPRLLVSTLTYEAAPATEALDEVTFEDTGGAGFSSAAGTNPGRIANPCIRHCRAALSSCTRSIPALIEALCAR